MDTKALLPPRAHRWARRCRGLRQRILEWPEQRRKLRSRAALQLGRSAFCYPIGDSRDMPGPLSRLGIEGQPHPLWYRHGTSDFLAIRQILVQREYDWLTRLRGIHSVLDLDANISTASVRLLNTFPSANVTAVEPMPD